MAFGLISNSLASNQFEKPGILCIPAEILKPIVNTITPQIILIGFDLILKVK